MRPINKLHLASPIDFLSTTAQFTLGKDYEVECRPDGIMLTSTTGQFLLTDRAADADKHCKKSHTGTSMAVQCSFPSVSQFESQPRFGMYNECSRLRSIIIFHLPNHNFKAISITYPQIRILTLSEIVSGQILFTFLLLTIKPR